MVATAPQTKTSAFEVKIGGTRLDQPKAQAIEEIVVDENVHLPAMLTVRLHVDDLDWLDAPQLAEGQEIEVIAVEQGTTPKPLFFGKITALELDLSEASGETGAAGVPGAAGGMPTLTLRAYDRSYVLHRHRYRRSFLNMSDSDLARKLAGEAGLSAQVDGTSGVYEYVYQNNQTDYEFLRERARRIGYDLYCDRNALCFKRPYQSRGAKTTLEWGVNLKSFRPRVSTFEPVSEVVVRGWDPKQKKEIIGRATRPQGAPQLGSRPDGAGVAQQTWARSTYVVTERVHESQGQADALATSCINELGGSFVEAEGVCDGNADLRAGRQVEVKKVGKRFNTTYYVTAARHTWTTAGGHDTAFSVSSRRDGSLSELIDGTRPQPTVHGPVVGIVTNINDDRDKMGRIKVKFPWLEDNAESHWARIAAPMSGNERGFNFLPEVNDEVLVDFEHGDITRPIIIGCLWNGKDKPPVPPSLPRGRDDKLLQGGNSKVKQRLIKSTQGNMIILDDTDGNTGLTLLGKSGAFVMIDDKSGDERIVIVDKTRKNSIEIHSQDNSIHILCEGPANIIAKQNVTVKTDMNMDAEATGNVSIKAQGQMSLESTGPLSIKSNATATVEASGPITVKGATATVEGQAMTEVKAATVNVNGTGLTTIKGGMVQIN